MVEAISDFGTQLYNLAAGILDSVAGKGLDRVRDEILGKLKGNSE